MPDATTDPITREALADLLLETGKHHHQAFAESDGADPEWALWYAGYLQTRLWNRAGTLPTRSLLVHLLIRGEAEHAAVASDEPWPAFYAGVILDALSSS